MEFISAAHCEVQINGTEIVLTDLNSKNGTFINDARAQPQGRATHGHVIRFGRVIARLDLEVTQILEAIEHEEPAAAKDLLPLAMKSCAGWPVRKWCSRLPDIRSNRPRSCMQLVASECRVWTWTFLCCRARSNAAHPRGQRPAETPR